MPVEYAGIPVTFFAPTTGASGQFTAAATVETDDTGLATAPGFTANTTAGQYDVSASADSLAPVTFTLTNLPDQPSQVSIVGGDGQETLVNTEFAENLQVRITDQYGNPIADAIVTFNAPHTGASATFDGNITYQIATDDNGVASTIRPVANDVPDTYTVDAGINELELAPVQFSLTNQENTQIPNQDNPVHEPEDSDFPGDGGSIGEFPSNPGNEPSVIETPSENPGGENPEGDFPAEDSSETAETPDMGAPNVGDEDPATADENPNAEQPVADVDNDVTDDGSERSDGEATPNDFAMPEEMTAFEDSELAEDPIDESLVCLPVEEEQVEANTNPNIQFTWSIETGFEACFEALPADTE
jgi:hypothetical protein